jgi:hypothetical protein
MMLSDSEEFCQLVALTQRYLLEEYGMQDLVEVNQENCHLFKFDATISNKKVSPQPPIPPQVHSQPLSNQRLPISKLETLPSTKSPILPESNQQYAAPSKETNPVQTQYNVNPTPTISTKNISTNSPEVFLKLEPFPPATIEPLDDMKTIFIECFPNYSVLDHPPHDDEAKNVLNRWKQELTDPEIIILSFEESPQQKLFLQNIAKAIQTRFGPTATLNAKKIEVDNQWSTFLNSKNLRLVIACDYALYSFNGLMAHYREASGSCRYLNEKPLLLISDLSLYMKESKLKPSLWKAICEMLV